MVLRRFQPISRAGQWREILSFPDPRTGEPIDLSDAVLALALYRVSDDGRTWRDYGWWSRSGDAPALSAQTNPDNQGPLRILPGGREAEFAFADLSALCPGSYLLIITATVTGATDEVLREPVVVLDGGWPPPAGPAVAAPPPRVVVIAEEF